jgi:hypothetical protein
MASSAPIADKKKTDPVPLIPPEEQFWKRYSPHGEAPLSVAGSFAVHALAVGGLMLFAVYLASLFYKPTRSLPIDPVRLELGGGGGKPGGSGDGPGIGQGNDVGEKADENVPGEENAERRPALAPAELAKIKESFAPTDVRLIEKSETGKALARMDEGLANKLRDGLNPGRGKGGAGSGGGKGTGKGTGEGAGTGPGRGTLNKREKRNLRWHLKFPRSSGVQHLAELRGLGAIIAFPVGGGRDARWKVIRDVRPGGKVLDEDVSTINRMYWIYDKPEMVISTLSALAVRLHVVPAQVIIFMPVELENQLLEMERGYVERVLKRTYDEDRIEDTSFAVVPTGTGKYKTEVISVIMK